MRICLVYDCLFPYTIGGAERWYRALAARRVEEGHAVTYLTLRQWPTDAPEHPPGVDVVAVGPRMALYDASGRRRFAPPLVFGLGVFWRLLRHGRDYDIVHTASFPYFSVLAAAAARPFGGFRLMVVWLEFWSRAYWRTYVGALPGRIGWFIQALCLRVPQEAFCFARLTAERLRAAGLRGSVTLLEGEPSGLPALKETLPPELLVVAAARHIPEKRMPEVVAAVAHARKRLPGLRGRILGDGPERPKVLSAIAEHGLQDVCDAPGFVRSGEVEQSIARALCLVHPSVREGYGLVVIEAAAAGTPVILVAGEDNAATELIEEGVNGFIAPSADPGDLAEAIVRVHAGGVALRASARAWFVRNSARLSIAPSPMQVVAEPARP